MNQRPFGSTGLTVSEIGMGCWAIGGGWGPVDDAESLRALRRAYELGVNFFDTADIYGQGKSEQLVGQALKKVRKEVIIATKVGNDFYAAPQSPFPHKKNFAPDYIRFALEQSLKRLATDVVDLYQLHNPPQKVIERGEVFETLERLKGEGKIRFYGVSIGVNGQGTPQEGLMAMAKGEIASLQVKFNILEPAAAASLFPRAKELGVAVIAREPLASGILSGKYQADTVFPLGNHRGGWSRQRLAKAVAEAQKFHFLVKGEIKTLAQAALRFVLSHDAVSVAIPGVKTVAQVEENVAASGTLSQEDLEQIRRLHQADFHCD